jgi:Ca2+-binding EF-hand superfamily protein
MSTISSSLASNWASSIFSKLDTSNQGYIGKSTLQSAFDSISSSSGGSSSSSVDDLFSSIDSDSDGKVTKSELTSSLEQLATQLNDAFDQMRMGGSQGNHGGHHGGPGGMAGGPPPGPPPSEGQNDTGFTKDELTQQLSDIGSSDSKRSSLMSSIVDNFDKADSNGDGKVNREEAMAFGKSQKTSSSSSSSSDNTGSTLSSSSSSSKSSEAAYMMQMMMLTQAYGGSSTAGLLNSSLSVSA